MNSRSGGAPRSSAVVTSICPAIAGWIASSLTWLAVGAMMNAVRNSVRPITIWFDGISCVPIACRRKWKTMAMRVNDVIITSAAGTNVSSVSRTTICSGADTAPTPSIFMLRFDATADTGGDSVAAFSWA